MPIPDTVTSRIVRGTYLDGSGGYQHGTVTFRLDQPLLATAASWGVVPTPVIATLDGAGTFSVELMASDDDTLFPSGFRWIVQERFSGGYIRTYAIVLVPDALPLDLPTATQYDPGETGLAVVHSVNGMTGIVTLDVSGMGAIPLTEKNAANGVATLDGTGKLAAVQIPLTLETQAGATAKVANHAASTTGVHGIANTAALETQAGAAAKVANHAGGIDPHGDRAYTDGVVGLHTNDTTNVHGIADTSVLETQSGAAAKVATHNADTTGVHGIADTAALETIAGSSAKVAGHVATADPHGDRAHADAALAAHSADTTNIHGIADTAALETTTGATAKVSAHVAASDPHGDRAFATSAVAAHEADTTNVHGIANTAALETTTGSAAKVAAHAAAADPHGDRAFATAEVVTHSADTTNVHGIADTAALETTTGATAKVSAHAGATDPHGDRAFTTSAVSAHVGAVDPHGDRAYSDAALSAHAADTTNVHGIADTSVLETTTGAAAKVSAHEAAFDPHGNRGYADGILAAHNADTTGVHGIADTSALETQSGATAKVAAHEADTTNVHGIADTAALETQAGATAKVATHTGATDPHGDRAFTTSSISTHSGATDPHGDRAFTTSAVSAHTAASDPHGDRAFAVQRVNHTGSQLASTISDFNAAVRTNRLDQMAAPTANVSLNSQKITNLLTGVSSSDAATVGQTSLANTLGWISAWTYGALGDGTTDDTTAIQNALNACPAGGVVYLPGCHRTSAPLLIPPQVTLRARHAGHIDNLTNPTIKPLGTFSGVAVIHLVDQATGGYSVLSNDQRIEHLSIDGSALPAGVDGIRATGRVHGAYITDVMVRSVTGKGLQLVSNGSGSSYSWHVERLHVSSSGDNGINGSMTDATWVDCEALGCNGHGWYIAGASNSTFLACRSEWSFYNGFEIGGSTGSGQGSGGFEFIGCSTDRNRQHGFNITSTGNGQISIVGATLRRDGYVSTSGGWAALCTNGATAPVKVSGLSIYPGVNDDGLGNNTPQYGISATSTTSLSYTDCHIHVASAAFFDGGGNTRVLRGVNIVERVGTTSSYTEVVSGVVASNSGLDVTYRAMGMVHPREHTLVAWSLDPGAVFSGKALTNGTLYLIGMYVPRSTTATRLIWGINTVGVTPTAGQNFVGLYNSAGTRLANIGVDARITNTGIFTETISVALTPGLYWGSILVNAATPPQVYRGGDLTGTLMNAGISSAASYRWATNGTGLTALPDPITPGSNASYGAALFMALG